MFCSEWTITKLGAIASVQTGPFGSQLHASDYVDVGIPSIMPTNIGDNCINDEKIARIKPEDAMRLSKYLVTQGDIVYSRRGDVEKRSLIRSKEQGWLCGTGCLRVRVDQSKIHPPFASYFLGHPLIQAWIVGHAQGATMPNLNTSILSEVPFAYPGLIEQRAIAAIISALDDKIQLNRQMNKTLEEMAQAIFKEWFVDFGPFRDGGMQDSELGPIPMGWRVGTISDLGQVIGGSTPSKAVASYYTDEGIPWITPKDLSVNRNKYVSKGAIDITAEGLQNSSAQIMPKGTVLFSSRAPIGYVAIAKASVTTNQGFKSVVPATGVGSEFLYYLLKWMTPEIEQRASGSTFKEISGSEMKKLSVLIPDCEAIKQFQSVASVLGEKMQLMEEMTDNLASLRDALLPKLMSGEIRVPVTEELA